MQQYDLNPQIIDLLKAEFEMKEDGQYLRGRCPECQKKELWTWLDRPGRVQCNRTNKCDFSATTKELFPELFEKLNEKYQATEENPNATADAYMSLIRGFNIADIKGWYEQGNYWHPLGDKGTATVRFFLDDAKTIMWERLIDDVTITNEDGEVESRNKNFKGLFKGLWWKPASVKIEPGDEVFWCEGIIDAISLNVAGHKAVAIMTSGMFPEKAIEPYLGKGITWVIALDNDKTGRRFLEKHAERLRDMDEKVTAVMTSSGESKKDWNDLYKANRLTEKHMHEYRYLGRLELAKSSHEKAQMMYEHRTQDYFIFTFKNRTYSANVDSTAYKKSQVSLIAGPMAELNDDELKEMREKQPEEQQKRIDESAFSQAAKIREIASFTMQFLYFQNSDVGDDPQYFFRLRFGNRADEKLIPFTGKTLSTAGDFKKAVKNETHSAQFVGTQFDIEKMYSQWMINIPREVRTLDFIGYDKTTDAYVFNKYAVQGGRLIELNDESFFQLKKSGIKTGVDIRQTLETRINFAWLEDFITAFSTKGLIALAWWFGCLFVQQIRHRHRSYPFLEMIGEGGSGKSDLVDFLWKLYGKEGESFNPNSSTLPGRIRKMSEVSNLPVVFNETDNEKSAEDKHLKRFNWNEQKDLFEGRFGRIIGVKSQDNSTKTPLFKAGLMVVQNVPIQAERILLSRTCYLNYDRSHHSIEGKLASDRLKMLPISDCSGFLLHAVKQSDRVMNFFSKSLGKYMAKLQKNKEIKLQRIIESHAKMMVLVDCLKHILEDLPEQLIDSAKIELEKMAVFREQSLNDDHETVVEFWARWDYLDNKPLSQETPKVVNGKVDYSRIANSVAPQHQMNHSTKPDIEIAINIDHFLRECRNYGLPVMDPKELRRHLPESKKRKFKENGNVHSRLEGRTVRCWVFER